MNSDQDTALDELVARLADGDRTAFDPVFRLLWPKSLRLCQSMLKHEADAADAAQQALTKILERAPSYDRTRAALPWALAIVAWECRTILRKKARRKEVAADMAPEASSDSSDAAFEQRELVQKAVEVLGGLSGPDRATLIATFQDEASSVAGPTFRKRRERALKRLRTAFRSIYGIG
jgi:RNA polymerase sigma-70 factor (ECF subfamily)